MHRQGIAIRFLKCLQAKLAYHAGRPKIICTLTRVDLTWPLRNGVQTEVVSVIGFLSFQPASHKHSATPILSVGGEAS